MGKRKQTGESLLPISINSLWLEHGLQWTSLAPPMVHTQTNDWNVQTNQLSFHQYKVCSYSVSRHILTSFPSGTNNKRPNTRQNGQHQSRNDQMQAIAATHTSILAVFLMYNRAGKNLALAAIKRQQQRARMLDVDIILFLVC